MNISSIDDHRQGLTAKGDNTAQRFLDALNAAVAEADKEKLHPSMLVGILHQVALTIQMEMAGAELVPVE